MKKSYEIIIVDDLDTIIDFINEKITDEKIKSDFFKKLDEDVGNMTTFTLLEIFDKNGKTSFYSLLLKLTDENKKDIIENTRSIKFENGGNLLLISCKSIEMLKKITKEMFIDLSEEGFNEIFKEYSGTS